MPAIPATANTTFHAMTFCAAISGSKRRNSISCTMRLLRRPLTTTIARIGGAASGSSARALTLPTRSRSRAPATSRVSSVALVEATRNRMMTAGIRMLGMSHALQSVHPGILQAEIGQPGSEGRTRTGGVIVADDPAVGVLAFVFEGDDVVQCDHLAFHAADIGDLRDATYAVAHALDLDDQINRAGDLGADRAGR